MDMAALMISLQIARRESRSALPDAEVEPDPGRGEKLWAEVRRLLRR